MAATSLPDEGPPDTVMQVELVQAEHVLAALAPPTALDVADDASRATAEPDDVEVAPELLDDPEVPEPEPETETEPETDAQEPEYVRVTDDDGSERPETERIGRHDRQVDEETRAPVATTRIGRTQTGERPTPMVRGGPGEVPKEKTANWKPVASRMVPTDAPVEEPQDGLDAVAMVEDAELDPRDPDRYPVEERQQSAERHDGENRDQAEEVAEAPSDAPDDPVAQPAQPVREALPEQVVLPLYGVLSGGSVIPELPERPDGIGTAPESVPEGPDATHLAAASGGQRDELRLAQSPGAVGNARADAADRMAGDRSEAIEGRSGGATDGERTERDRLDGDQGSQSGPEGHDPRQLGATAAVQRLEHASQSQRARPEAGGAAGTAPTDQERQDPSKTGQSPTNGLLALTGLPRTAPSMVGSEDLPLSSETALNVRADELAAYWDEIDELLRQAMRIENLPLEARALGLKGTVGLTFVIDGRGRVVGAAVTRESGNADLDRWTLDALPSRFPRPPEDAPSPLHVRWDRRVWDHWATGNEG